MVGRSGNPNGAAAPRRARQGDKVAIAAVVLGTSQRTGAIPERIRRHDASPDLLEAIGAAVLADGRLGVPQKNI